MLGDNPKRPAIMGDGTSLLVKNIFKTLQGEGPHAGLPAIFIRLGGCNLACSFCDTEFEDYQKYALSEIVDTIEKLSLNSKSIRSVALVIITGGEPFRQPINRLCEDLLSSGFAVQIETNGTLYREIPKDVDIICSPKVSNNKYLSVQQDLLPRVTAFKFLISGNIEFYASVPELGQLEYNIPVFVQAMDEYDAKINAKNQQMAVDLAINNGYRLSYQIHKNLGIE
ncbi:MAG: 7-carboxy-7-deazaguanine synthase QueE [Rickettsiaceae bacterium]|nr:7-carboxy-7-deazaguanine synthase QueE [Rickettsiaceae bacterium]MDP4832869.1 7-carboxy-7-deazaguanine synthase QueE [Rickettsiaceae bacterium]MDP5021075.1 7-carboxy-7-deazaguanine synthase QueE [Rickettsiaceae bacterium]MDP5082797.1 7-carboxy-7-deazaguanine synthase QueE [Rickettsiaceae bacterium]